MPALRHFEVTDVGDVTVVKFTKKIILDRDNGQTVGEQLFALEKEGKRKILLNLGNVEHVSSVALGKFIALHKALNNRGGKVVFCSIDVQVYPVFEQAHLDTYFCIRDDEETGLQAF